MTGMGRKLVRDARASLRRRVRRLRRRLRPTAGSRLLRAFAEVNPDAFFIEIGANDGKHHDHLRPHILERTWSGIMVEPVPHIFQELERNYGGLDGVALENVAIADSDGELPFYYLTEATADDRIRLPNWYDGVGSFSRETVLSHARDIPDLEDRLVTETVPTLTFSTLCARHSVRHVELLILDTEGYDWEILKTIDLSMWRPELVIYEHFHLSPETRVDCAEWMQRHGYETMEEALDTFCLASTVNGKVRSVWEQLVPTFPGVSKSDELP